MYLVDELRKRAKEVGGEWSDHYLFIEAAKEIETLRNLTVREVEFPVLNGILTEKLLAGARIDYQDYEWHLFANDGNGIAHGKTISKMLENLIWAED